MPRQITTRTVGRGFAEIEEDFVLEETPLIRTVFRAQIHSGGIRGKIIRMHRASSTDEWQTGQTIPIRTINAGEGVCFELKTEVVKKLDEAFDELKSLLEQQGIRYGRTEYVSGTRDEVIATDANKARFINELLEKGYSEDFWQQLVTDKPDLATRLSWSKISADRKAALDEFEAAINDSSKDESWWQDFFERNTWIFGYGLSYQVLRNVQTQPNYGGTDISGSGGQRGDFLEKTAAEISFTALVEIKKPSTPLMGHQYRNGAWSPSEELSGGITQVQVNCHMWEKEGSVTDANRDYVEGEEAAFTVRPRGIIVIGKSSSLADRNKIKSFELLRRNTKNPEIITFDELMERARFIVDNTSSEDDAE